MPRGHLERLHPVDRHDRVGAGQQAAAAAQALGRLLEPEAVVAQHRAAEAGDEADHRQHRERQRRADRLRREAELLQPVPRPGEQLDPALEIPDVERQQEIELLQPRRRAPRRRPARTRTGRRSRAGASPSRTACAPAPRPAARPRPRRPRDLAALARAHGLAQRLGFGRGRRSGWLSSSLPPAPVSNLTWTMPNSRGTSFCSRLTSWIRS